MIWGCITWSGRGTLCKINGNMNAEKYISILDEQLLPVIVRHFPDNSYIFQVTRHKYHRNLLASGEEKFAKTGRRNFYQISCSMLFLTFGRMSQLINSCLHSIKGTPHKVLKVCEFSYCVENGEFITLSEVTLIDVRHFPRILLARDAVA